MKKYAAEVSAIAAIVFLVGVLTLIAVSAGIVSALIAASVSIVLTASIAYAANSIAKIH